MILDFHTHYTPGLKEEMRRCGVSKAVVMFMKRDLYSPDGRLNYATPEEISDETKRLYEEGVVGDADFIPFLWWNSRMPDAVETAEKHFRKGFRGLKLHPVVDNYDIRKAEEQELLHELIGCAIRHRVPVMVHTGWLPQGSVYAVADLAERFPEGKFVIAHMKEEYGINPRMSHIEVARKHENIYLECSYVEHSRRIRQAVSAIGSGRVLYGSDFPLGGDAMMEESMAKVRWAKISEKEKEDVLGNSAARLLGMLE